MADISKIKVGSTTYNIKDSQARDDIETKADKTALIPLNAAMADTHSLSDSEESYLLNSVIKKSNRNFFDNPWMEINQRGVTSVNGQAYFCDRWRANTSSTKVTLIDDYLKVELVSGKTNVENVDQQIEDFEFFAGKEVTVSCYYKGAELQIAYYDTSRVTVGTFPATENWTLATATFTVPDSLEELDIQFVFQNNTVGYLKKKFKLELGAVSTIEVDEKPDYDTELLKCQRYFIKYTFGSTAYIGNGASVSGSTARILIYLPVSMRVKPTAIVSSDSDTEILLGGTAYATTAVHLIYALTNNVLTLTASASGMTARQQCSLRVKDGESFTLELSADL